MVLTKELLNEYSRTIKELEVINRKIDYYSRVVAKSEHGVVMGSMKDYPYAEKHFVLSGSDITSDEARQEKLKQLLIDLSAKRKHYDDVICDIGIELEKITDSEISTILFEKYVEGKSDSQIADDLGYERSAISKKIKRFFEEM